MIRLCRPACLGLALLAGVPAAAQPRPAPKPVPIAAPALSASRSLMAGAMLSVGVAHAPDHSRLAIARPDDPATRAIVVLDLTGRRSASVQTPGEAGSYELRLTQDRDGAPVILLRQPLVATPPSATVAGPARIARGKPVPARGIGPNGEQDRVVIAPVGAAADAAGPFFYPHENVEATLDAPDQAGAYELRYVMHAPLAEHRILARQAIAVD